MQQGALCPRCNTATVVFDREDPPGIRLYRCMGCGEVKRSCPMCGEQGWLEHYVVSEEGGSRYICDECMSTWDSFWKRLTVGQGAAWPDDFWGPDWRRVVDFERPVEGDERR